MDCQRLFHLLDSALRVHRTQENNSDLLLRQRSVHDIFLGLFFYVFPTLSTVVNPIILFISSSRFSQALKETFSCFTCKHNKRCKCERVSPQHDDVGMQIM